MTRTHTTTNHYCKALVALAVLTVLASLMAAMVVRPAGASTTFTVNSTADASDTNHNDNTCDANLSNVPVCTLRAAIEQANATPGADAIDFAIPYSGVQTIHVNSSGYGELPAITDSVTINGYSQTGASKNTLSKGTNAKLMIQLDGSKVTGESSGLYITAPGVVVEGLIINRFVGGGMIMTDGANNSSIEGNFIGTDPSGTLDRGNLEGGMAIWKSSNVTVGGSSPAARNLISGNGERDSDHGVSLGGDGNEVSGNLIGTQKDGESPLGNSGHGVAILSGSYSSASENAVGRAAPGYANTIAFNGGDGVAIFYGQIASSIASYNPVLSNSVFSNGGVGIDLGDNGVTPNDAGDADKGPNFRQNYPVLSSAKKNASGKTTIKGKLNSTPNTSFTVQFFKNPQDTDEGKTLLFSRTVTTDGPGNVSFAFATKKKVVLAQNITATATDSTGNTSEFSAPRKVVAS